MKIFLLYMRNISFRFIIIIIMNKNRQVCPLKQALALFLTRTFHNATPSQIRQFLQKIKPQSWE